MELTTLLSRDRHDWMRSPLRRRDNVVLQVDVEATLPDGHDDQPTERIPTNLVVVLDRSGSMNGEPLEHAKRALCDVVAQLTADDAFGLVVFDDQVDVVVPVGPVADRAAVQRLIQGVRAGGSTDLGGGLVRGLEEARRLDSAHGVRVLLISDGRANRGIVDPVVLGTHVGRLLAQRITTSTLGMGLRYDEALLSAIARAGSGNEHFAESADDAVGAIGDECGELLAQRFLACRLLVAPASGIHTVDVVNEVTGHDVPLGFEIDLGGMRLGETRSLVLECSPHVARRPGRRKIGKIELRYVLADDLSDHVTSTTVWTHVARPDEKVGRADRAVLGEWYVQRVLRRKRKAMQALALGDREGALEWFERVKALAVDAATKVSRARAVELMAEIDEADRHLVAIPRADRDHLTRTSKSLSRDIAMRSRKNRWPEQPPRPQEDS